MPERLMPRGGLTIAIVAHNEALNIERTLRSLLPRSKLNFPWEILVIDNASTDHTVQHLSHFKKSFPKISLRWILHRENNLGMARKRAIEEAQFPFVAFLDADCSAPPDWTEKFFHSISSLSEGDRFLLGVGGGNKPPTGESSFYDALTLLLCGPIGLFGSVQAKPLDHERRIFHLPTCNICLVKERALCIGNFSEDFRDVCEDLEFSRRAQQAGYHFQYLTGLSVRHYHKIGWRKWAKKMFRYGRGQIAVARRYPKHLLGLKGLPILAALAGITLLAAVPYIFLSTLISALILSATYAGYLCLQKKERHLWPSLMIGLLITPLFYCLGEIWGLFQLRKVENRKVNQRERERARLLTNHLAK